MDCFLNFAATKENEGDLQVLIWETLQDTQSGKKAKCKTAWVACYHLCKEGLKQKSTCLYLLVYVKKQNKTVKSHTQAIIWARLPRQDEWGDTGEWGTGVGRRLSRNTF